MRAYKWRMALPRLRIARLEAGTVSSFRWFGFGWDAIASKHSFFIQFGWKRTYFFTFGKQPTFTLSPSWKKIKQFRTMKFGTTVRPHNVAHYWRKHDALWSRETLRREDGTTPRLAGRIQLK